MNIILSKKIYCDTMSEQNKSGYNIIRRSEMIKFSYKPLWKLMIDKDLNNNDFMEKTNISRSTFYKLKHNENVTTDVLLRICNEMECDISEIIECVEEEI